MDLTKDETKNLNNTKTVFNIPPLTKQQAKFTLGRKLTDNAWQVYATSESRKHKNTKDKVYSLKHLFQEPREKASKTKFDFKDIAKHAAKKHKN